MLAKTVGLLLLEDIPTMADMTLGMDIFSKRRYFHRSHPLRRESINYKCMDLVNALLTEGSLVFNLQRECFLAQVTPIYQKTTILFYSLIGSH